MSAFLTIKEFEKEMFDIVTKEGMDRRMEVIELTKGDISKIEEITTVLQLAYNGDVCHDWVDVNHNTWHDLVKKYENLGNEFRRKHCSMTYNEIENYLKELDSEVYYVGQDEGHIQFKLPTCNDSLGFDKALKTAWDIKEQNEIIENIEDYDMEDLDSYIEDEELRLDYDEM